MRTECQGLFGKLFGHKFVGQYNTVPPNDLKVSGGGAASTVLVAESLTKKTYVCSVCERCGEKA